MPRFFQAFLSHRRAGGGLRQWLPDPLPKLDTGVNFSCNCVLNFLYANLEGKRSANITGPVTFGEIGYRLLNQTLVHLTLNE